jgi:hypothetical protein
MRRFYPLSSCCLFLFLFIGVSFQSLSQPKTYYVASDGNDDLNTGLSTSDPLATINKAVGKIVLGDTIYVRGGVYRSTAQITLSLSGTDSLHRYYLLAYPGERPLLDYSSMGTPRLSGSADGIRVTGKYWYIKGLDVKGAQHNGIAINGGSDNIIEYC